MKARFTRIALVVASVVALAGCSSSEEVVRTKNAPKVASLNKAESCTEVFRLLGKATDETMNDVPDWDSLVPEWENLARNSSDSEIRESAARFVSALNKAANEATLAEGISSYTYEILTISQLCVPSR